MRRTPPSSSSRPSPLRVPATAPFPPTRPLQEKEEEAAEEAALSISDQRTLYLVNIFIGNTTRFLNSFSAICEQKLLQVHRRILRLDATLTLLEAKLRSSNSSTDPSSSNCPLQGSTVDPLSGGSDNDPSSFHSSQRQQVHK